MGHLNAYVKKANSDSFCTQNKLKSNSQFFKKVAFICFKESPLKVMKNAFYFN